MSPNHLPDTPDFPSDPEFISAREASRRAVEQAGLNTGRLRQTPQERERTREHLNPNEPAIPDFLRSHYRDPSDIAADFDTNGNARAAMNQKGGLLQGSPYATPFSGPTQASWNSLGPQNQNEIDQLQYGQDIDSALKTVMERSSNQACNQSDISSSFEEFASSLAGLDLSAIESKASDMRWAWAEIDLSAIRHNIAVTRQQLNSRTRIMAVVKADAYGHGALEVSRAALNAGVYALGVATVPEALELRRGGITAPILLLSQPPATAIPLIMHYALTPSVYTPDFAIAYGEVADQMGKKAPFHLAMNTGMNRIGVNCADVVEFMHQISFHRALELEGIFTHFATADCHESLEFERQRKHFEDAILDLRAANINTGIIHAANSAAIYRYPHVHYDMVRLGISLYGFHPCPETRPWVDLRPVMSVHARISDTRRVPMSEGVSYGFTYRSPGSVKICTIPLGYGDGLSRQLSNNTEFIVEGRYYRQIGNICMDQCMFEVDMRRRASVPFYDPHIGDHVIIVGKQGAAEITVDEIAEKLGTVCHQVTIGFGERLQRIYT